MHYTRSAERGEKTGVCGGAESRREEEKEELGMAAVVGCPAWHYE